MSTITISVKDMAGIETPLTILDSKTINEGKTKLGHNDDIIWKHDGKILELNKTFFEYEVESGDTIIATRKVHGGIN